MSNQVDALRFDGKAILITGAGRGLGREYALLLAARGARVVVSDNGASLDGSGEAVAPADSVVEEIRAAGGEAVSYLADLSNEQGARGAVDTTIAAFGRIDGIIHNAGISPAPQDPDQVSDDAFDLMLKVNAYAAFWIVSAAWPHMRSQGGGRIVMTISSAIYGASGSLAYCTAKSALLGFGRSLSIDGARDNIHTNMLAPTAATRMTERFPPSKFVTWFNETLLVEKVAPLVAYLCHDSCTLNGETLAVAGGRIARIRTLETLGDIGANETIEEVRDRLPAVMDETEHFFPIDPPTRSMKIAELLGYDVGDNDDPYGLNSARQN